LKFQILICTLRLSPRLWFVAIVLGLICKTATAAGPVTTVMLSGMPAPGMGEGVTFAPVANAFVTLNNTGHVAFATTLSGGAVTDATNNAVWTGAPGALQLVARKGDLVNSASGPITWPGAKHAYINSAGQILLAGDSIAVGAPGDVTMLARLGAQAPGAPPGANFAITFGSFDPDTFRLPVLNAFGQVALTSFITGGGVTPANNAGVWAGDASSFNLVAQKGGQLPGMPAGTSATSFGAVANNAAGEIAFVSGYGTAPNATTGSGIWAGAPGSLSLVVGSGDAVPGLPAGTTFKSVTGPAIIDMNDAGQIAFFGAAHPTVGNDVGGFWLAGPGGIDPILISGQQAPGLPAGTTIRISDGSTTAPSPPFVNAQGHALVITRIDGPSIQTDAAIWAGAPDDMKLIAYRGQQALGFPAGVTYNVPLPYNAGWPPYPMMNDMGQVAFCVVTSDGGVGVWGTDLAGVLHLVVKTGDALEVAPGDFRTVNDLVLTGIGSSSGGKSSGFNDQGQLAFWASFTDGSSGVFISNAVAVPEPATFALAAIGCAAALWQYRRRRFA